MFVGLTRFDEQTGEVTFDLATSASVSASGLVWTFNLRSDVLWSDGSRVTASDVDFGIKRTLDPQYVVIGGGLMDPEATTDAFRERYLRIVRETAAPNLWPVQRTRMSIVPASLGDLSPAIGAALVSLYRSRS